ncbi:dihydrofolate reductase [Legionella nagasakiensis]|uniref:dihydrofolate reductase n=1 Tax=Legionella nagasakiensis TaxID=535290 RepID=UPI0010554422|nr:dihydrofolate reductase [Legionella nagasakiensis]
MTLISLIAAVDEHGALGKDNQLLCYLPADLRHFKALTLGKPILMGRKTYESIGKPLAGRLNLVLSKRLAQINGAVVVDTLNRALELTRHEPEIMIIGGAHVYEQTLPFAQRIYLTKIHHQFDADVFFPKLEENTWQVREAIFRPHDEKNKYDMTFYRYEKI